MNKQISLLALGISSLFSVPSYAVEGGQDVKWVDYPYLVESKCTGTVLAGNKVLLAGHCFDVNHSITRTVNLYNEKQTTGISINTLSDPSIPDDQVADVAIWTLSSTVPMNKVAFIADLNNATTLPQVGDTISFVGFGQYNHIPKLTKAINKITDILPEALIYSGALAHSVPGDSGAPVFNSNNQIIAVNYSGSGSPIQEGLYRQNGVNLRFVKDWLLEGVNAWHSPTELKFTGDKTIEIQSLHVKNANLATRQNDGALTTGDVAVTGGSCVTDGEVSPFGTCTLELKSNGGEGHVQLEDGNTITVNRAPKPEPKPQPKPDGGKSGGSMGYLSLLGLLALAFRRKNA
ncbi:trypsin-like serine protease [Photobacterium damselae subsp. piscicida]|uniref:trypsin-like serine peptidase n=1 Tax=Photobacterium damselae TaxID=38293 RepID=UPI0010767ECC|nr:trypsin-like serine protease [Photobacterium damselae]TFZ62431.1 trypsin-like serine protease [Photobacterium damselae subsp. piscicida]